MQNEWNCPKAENREEIGLVKTHMEENLPTSIMQSSSKESKEWVQEQLCLDSEKTVIDRG